ncbi:hypothetical protein Sgly_1214 [Syntrophobotulus glycolicus DSM 8271]|uniref:Transcriptional regulator HTH-type FeoC domain-containing protein n=1 Tax=Syntrophobotulus glycolicus (strain DSM 8271 / FlGlyR) TaxID=645991 RepID=F0SUN8_SYNGF|nr:FeoC-like transcriptional regulator [Syntrophobotulus glycolicus]ADY55531.1 hypothetical protein Sgly_1214 [Syntrophobotulus glycolicus DSM 8271]
MIRELLHCLRSGRVYCVDELAYLLDTSQEAVRNGLDYLERKRYIRRAEMAAPCSEKCKSCHLGDAGQAFLYPAIWELKTGERAECMDKIDD